MIPKNIRQIGEGETAKKVYIEDYVITFLKQVQKKLSEASQSVSLYGHIFYEEGVIYAIVKGAAFAQKEGETYFSDYELIGQAVILAVDRRIGEVTTTANLLSKRNGESAVYFEIRDANLEEDLEFNNDFFDCGNMFFVENGKLESLKSYYVFYEKNDTMQDYLIDWNNRRDRNQLENVKDRAVNSFRKNYYEKQELIFHKKMMVYFYALSTCMLMIFCVMGITMINSFDKMKNLEVAMGHLVTAMNEQKLPDTSGEISVKRNHPIEEPSSEKDVEEAQNEEEISSATIPTNELETQVMKENQLEVSNIEETRKVYTVQEGDTLAKISEKFYETNQKVEEICNLNKMDNPNKIVVGEKILLP